MNLAGQPSAAASPAPPDAWVGRLVGGRWKILSLLDDSGGMASVYLADDERLPRKAVVKIPKAAQQNAEFRERFAREAHHHAAVENVHVVNILDRGEEAGTPFLVLQYLPGGNLKAWCAKNPSILADPRLHYEAWLLPIAQALDAVAAKGIVHRDVKPTNILFDADGKGYLSDFGIVKAGGDATMTGTGMFIGTLQFMSPEQCHRDGKQSLDGRSDQFGLAVTAYQVLTGWKYPVEDDTAVVYAAKFGMSPMTTPREHDPQIPEAVNDTVMRALSPDRDKRFATSVEFAQAVLAGFAGAGRVPPTDRPSAAMVDTAPHRPGSGAGAASGRPGGIPAGQPQQAVPPGPSTGWTPAKLLLATGILATVASGAFLVGRSGSPSDPRRITASQPAGVAEPRAAAAATPPTGRDFEVVENSLGMKLVRIPAGQFEMGSNDGEADEQPPHPVRITRPFLLGQTEVTQEQFERVMGTTPWQGGTFVKDGPTVAASYVSWDDAIGFCRKLTEIERRAARLPGAGGYRLPTEAEWEYACRAGTKTKWSFGDDESRLGNYAWFDGNADRAGEEYAHDVGQKNSNPWKLYDMHGNVYEWCSDWYDKDCYAKSPAADPKAAAAGSFRVTRGGGWNNNPVDCRSALRHFGTPSNRISLVGFRVVCELE